MAGALERVAALAEQPPRRRQWRHDSIAARMAAVRAAGADPAVRARYERRARWAAWSAPALLIAGGLALVTPLRVEVATGCLRAAAQRGDAAAAAAWYASALRVRPPDASVHQAWGDACESLERPAEAAEAYRRALASRDCGADQRRALERRLATLRSAGS
jgi:Flp pilus assembly protein TadD